MYENPWIYEDEIFDPESEKNIKAYEGFVYIIEHKDTGKKYIGKKHFWTRQKNKKTGRRVTKESDWRNYYGSSEALSSDIDIYGKQAFSRKILFLCIYKKEMTFNEEQLQWNMNVLLDDNFYNTNIGGKFFVRERKIYSAKFREVTTKNDEWRRIKSEQMTGENNIAKRDDVRKKISDKKKGSNHHQFGKHISEEHKVALKEGHKRKFEEIRQSGIESPLKGRSRSAESIEKGKATRLANKKEFSEEAKLKMKESALKRAEQKVCCLKCKKEYSTNYFTGRHIFLCL